MDHAQTDPLHVARQQGIAFVELTRPVEAFRFEGSIAEMRAKANKQQ